MPRALGYVATSATTEVAVEATTYNEPSTASALSIKSASANDTAAGSGARTVKVTYFTLASDGTISGPAATTVTMNGTAAVVVNATSAVYLIDKLEVITAGSGGVAAGIISLFPSSDGTGTAITSIAASDRRTYLAHAYVPSGVRANIADLSVVSGEAATVQTQFNLRKLAYGVTGATEQPLNAALAAQGLNGTKQLAPFGQPIAVVSGPARVRLYVTPGASTATTQRAEFGYYFS